MIDISKHIVYWLEGAKEDWEVAGRLAEAGKTRHGLFFCHLALEKILKAHVCKHSRNLAPRLHNLPRLAELAGLNPSASRLDVLADINEFNIEGRYPMMIPAPTIEETQDYIDRAEEVFQWLIRQL